MNIDDLYEFAIPEQPAVSPDGSRIAYVLRTVDRAQDREVCTLWQVAADGGPARQLTRGTADTAPAWSPDGRGIAFLRAGDLWLLPTEGGEPEQLSTGAGTPVWSPDGGRIAFAAPVDLADEHAPVVVDRLGYKADGAGLLRTVRRHLHILDVETHEVRQLTAGDWNAGEPAWSPDGKRLAFPAALDPEAFSSAVYLVDVAEPEPRLVGSASGAVATVTWTADGRALVVTGRRDTEVGNAGLLLVPVDGGETVELTGSLDRNVMPGGPGYPGAAPSISADGRSVLFCARDRGCTHLYAVELDGGAPRLVLGGAGNTVSGLSRSGETVAVVLATADSFGEIATLQHTLTAHGPKLELFDRQEREFSISDGTTVHGWLLRDPRHDGPVPLLLDIHGGPHNAWNGTADPAHIYHQVLAARGWAVLLLNPRGSDGYGERFLTAALGAWGEADARDFLEPLDQLVAEGIADTRRLAVSGYSYGGFMTCYLTSRDNRFAAAVAGGVVSDLTSMVGTSDLGHYLGVRELGERRGELSPLAEVDQVRTPTLILHGAADDRCPVGQAEQWFTALRERNVPTRLVLYPGSSHLFILSGTPSHRADFNRRIVDWVQRHAGTAPAPIEPAHWQQRLRELAREHRIPGATLGILRIGADGDDLTLASHGVLSKATGVEVTEDSLFQIGSITKVWTATVALQLVDEGLLDLDAPILDVLPGLRLGDPDVARQVSMRQLLTHTSGIDGDVFTDCGRGDDCLRRYVEQLDEVGQNHPLGATFSYCNSGFVLAGRVIEQLTGQSWDTALRERLFTPLGLDHTVTLPEQALLFRAAVGHDSTDGADPEPAQTWVLPRSMGPAGLVTSSAADVLAFARMHLAGGLAADGERILSAESAATMAELQVDLSDMHTIGDSWGLGWIRFDWDGHPVIGHDGNTIGQSAFLRLLPEQGLAVVLLTNGGNAHDLYEALYPEIFTELTGVAVTRPLEPSAEPPLVDAAEHVGRYERAALHTEISFTEQGLRLRETAVGPLAELIPRSEKWFELIPISANLFVFRLPGVRTWIPVTFYTLSAGERYIHYGVRAARKVS